MKRLTTIEFLIYLANGLFTPAWYILLYQRGGDISQFGLLIGLMAIGAAVAAYFSGTLSHGKPYRVLGVAVLTQALLMALYIPAFPLWSLYALQISYGIISAALLTVEQVCISRLSGGNGKTIGSYGAIMHGSLAVAMIVSGFIASLIGASALIGFSALILAGAGVLAFSSKL